MIPTAPEIIAARQKREFVRTHHLIRIEARNRTTGAVEAMGLWDGEDNIRLNPLNTGELDYLAAGRVLSFPDFQFEAGLDARTYEVSLSQTDEAVQIAIRQYDPHFGNVYIFRTEWDGEGKQIGAPRMAFKGFIDGTPIDTPELEGENGGITLRIVSDAKMLTFYGSHMENHDFQKLRNNDQFRKYSSVQTADVPWGMKRDKNKAASLPAVRIRM